MGRRAHLTGLVIFLSVFVSGQGPVQDAAPADPPAQPQPPPHQPTLNRNLVLDRLRFNRHTLVDAYEGQGDRDPAWDDDAVALLEAAALHDANLYEFDVDEPAPISNAELNELAQLVADTATRDPLLRMAVGFAADFNNRNGDARDIYISVLDHWDDAPYDPHWELLTLTRLLTLLPAEHEDKPRYLDQLSDAVIASASMPYDDPRELRHRWRMIRRVADNDHRLWSRPQARALLEAVVRAPDADPWLVDLLLGKQGIEVGWDSRGNDVGRKVHEDGWLGFEAGLTMARKALVRAHERRPDFPEAAEHMITVTMGGHGVPGRDERWWYDRAAEAELDADDAVDSLLYALRPRWRGSHEQMLAFAEDAVATGRFDTGVVHAAKETIDQVSKDLPWHDPFFRQPRVQDLANRYYQGMINEPRHERNHDGWRNEWAAAAWRTGQYDVAKRIIDELDHTPYLWAWERYGAFDPVMNTSEAYAKAKDSGVAHLVDATQQHLDRGAWDAAVTMGRRAGEKIGPDHNGIRYVRALVTEAEAQRALLAGETVALLPADHLSAFQLISHDWKSNPDGGMTGTSVKAKYSLGLMALTRWELPPRLEFTGTITDATVQDADDNREASLFFAVHLHRDGDDFTEYRVRFGIDDNQIDIDRNSSRDHSRHPVPLDLPLDYRLVWYEQRVGLWVNGVQVVDREIEELHHGNDASYFVGGGTKTGNPGRGITFQTMNLRLLETDPWQAAPAEPTPPLIQ